MASAALPNPVLDLLQERTAPQSSADTSRLAALVLIIGAAVLRILYLVAWCPFDLSPDEAHYWEWSRRLDWSYYSKGPLVAWIVRLSCELLGPWSQAVVGSPMLAVRVPAVLFGSLTLGSLYMLAARTFRSEGWGLAVVAIALTWPILGIGSILMTIDAPFVCLWGWTLVAVRAATFDRVGWAWPVAGILLALGCLAKHTMVLWIPSYVLFLWFTPAHRPLLRSAGFWSMAAIAGLGCIPIVLWNMTHGWVMLLHAGLHSGFDRPASQIQWAGPFVYVGTQFCVLLGLWFWCWVRAAIQYRPSAESNPELRYLWFLSVPTFVFFGLFSFKNGGGGANWPLAAYLSGMVLCAWRMKCEWELPRPTYVRVTKGIVVAFCILGLGLTVLAHDMRPIRPLLAPFLAPPSERQTMPMRRLDPTCRLEGWRTLAAAVGEVRDELRSQGIEPVLAGASWFIPAEIAFGLPDHPDVFSVGTALGDRDSQYDLWRPNPIADEQAFRGRTFVLAGSGPIQWQDAFDSVEQVRFVAHCDRGHVLNSWNLWIGRGFRGFRARRAAARD